MTSPRKKCRSGKFRYTSEATANNQLAQLRERAARDRETKGFTRRRERSAYACADCGGWHLTSKGSSPAAPIEVTVADQGETIVKEWDARALDDV